MENLQNNKIVHLISSRHWVSNSLKCYWEILCFWPFCQSLEQVMSNQEAVDCIKHIKDAQSAAKRLTDEALSKKSKDDISCIVVKFQWFSLGNLSFVLLWRKTSCYMFVYFRYKFVPPVSIRDCYNLQQHYCMYKYT